jgi:alpha-mannosidase
MTTMRITTIEPTVFFVRERGEGADGRLRQLVRVGVENVGELREACLELEADGGCVCAEALGLGALARGPQQVDAYFPDLREPVTLRLRLWADGAVQDERVLAWQPQKHWEVYLIQYAHHDMGYTDLPSHVLVEYDGFMDQVLEYCAETEHWPEEEARFRYLCEQTWSVLHYLENRPPAVIDRMAHYVRNGQIEVTALFGNQTLELCSSEELIRLMYPSFSLKRELGIEISSAEHNDIPGFTWGLASALAGAGVRYFSPGVPFWYFGRGESQVHPLWDPEKALPFGMPWACWWEGPDGAKVLLWHDLHGGEWQPYDVSQAMAELPGMLASLDERGYPFDMVSYTLRGGHRDNAPPTLRYCHLVREWNRRWAYPRLINATNRPFLEEFERRWGHTLKTLRGDVPGTDYPVGATGTPKETAIDRNAHELLHAAEAWACVAALHAGHDYPADTLERAYREVFYYDLHCWGLSHIGGPAQDGHWAEKGIRAYRGAALAHDVLVKATNRLADKIQYPDDGYYLTVFNPLAEERTDLVRASLSPWGPCGMPMHWRGPDERHPWPVWVAGRAIGRDLISPPAALFRQPFDLVDVETGEQLPYQLVGLDSPLAAQPWAAERYALGQVGLQGGHDNEYLKELVFVAGGLPALGYRTYRIVPCSQWPSFAHGASAGPTAMENEFYRLEADPVRGGIVSLVDKELGRQWVDPSAAHVLGQFIVRASDTAQEEVARVTDSALVEHGPVCSTLRLRASASCCPRIVVEITLYHGLKRIDLAARILRDSTPMRELYIAFPFEVEQPQFRFEAPGSVIEPIRDQWPGSCTDYYGVQRWATVGNGRHTVTWTALDTPMVEFGGLWPGYVSEAHHGVRGPGYGHPFLQEGQLTRGHIYSLVSYNNFRTNFVQSSPSEYLVRYAFTAQAGDWRQGRARRFGWSVQQPPLGVWMRGPQAGGALPACTSFCHLDAPNVALLTLKRAEDGDGIIARLVETEGQETRVSLTMPWLRVWHAYETNLVEENQRLLPSQEHSVSLTVRPFGTATIRLAARRGF